PTRATAARTGPASSAVSATFAFTRAIAKTFYVLEIADTGRAELRSTGCATFQNTAGTALERGLHHRSRNGAPKGRPRSNLTNGTESSPPHVRATGHRSLPSNQLTIKRLNCTTNPAPITHQARSTDT